MAGIKPGRPLARLSWEPRSVIYIYTGTQAVNSNEVHQLTNCSASRQPSGGCWNFTRAISNSSSNRGELLILSSFLPGPFFSSVSHRHIRTLPSTTSTSKCTYTSAYIASAHQRTGLEWRHDCRRTRLAAHNLHSTWSNWIHRQSHHPQSSGHKDTFSGKIKKRVKV